ncbi:hypothetical protein BHE74_00027288 [Ensete ventricosum]|nr:hypothetical protein BHE74_00027288 [Ensete ventricosum]
MLGQCPVWPSDCGSNDATGTRREITESSPKVLGACWGFVGSSSKVIESLSKYTGGSPEDDRDSLGVHQRHSEDEEYNQEEVENLVLMAINNKEFAKGIGKLIRKTPGDHRRKTIRLAARMSEAVGLAGLHQDAVIFFIQSSLSLLYVSRHYVTPAFPTSPSHRGKSTLMRGCLISVACSFFLRGLSELSPCWNLVGLGDRRNPNSANKARNLSSMRDSNASNFASIEP